MKTTFTKLSLSTIAIAVCLTVPSSASAALTDWHYEVEFIGTSPAATHFLPVSGSSPIQVDVGALSGNRSFEFIVNAGNGGVSSALLGTSSAGGNQGLKFEQWSDSGVFGMTVFGVIDLYSTAAIILNADTHVVFTSDGVAGTDLYVNGALVYSFAGYPLALSGPQGLAGIYSGTPGSYIDNLDGIVAGFASYDSALSGTEIMAHYRAFVVPEPSTLALLTLGSLGLCGGICRRRRS